MTFDLNLGKLIPLVKSLYDVVILRIAVDQHILPNTRLIYQNLNWIINTLIIP